jgi:hypothetical protein
MSIINYYYYHRKWITFDCPHQLRVFKNYFMGLIFIQLFFCNIKKTQIYKHTNIKYYKQ